MSSKFLPTIDAGLIESARISGDSMHLYDLLVQPLHEELYKQQTFSFIDDLGWAQQLLLAYDYLQMQADQGGFIQFIHNGYVGLLPSLIEQLNKIGAADMALVLDDALKVYVLNRDLLEEAKSVEEFAKLYDELKEFEEIDRKYNELKEETIKIMLDYALTHLSEFFADA